MIAEIIWRRTDTGPAAPKRAEAMKFSEFEHQFLPHILIPLLGGMFVLGVLHSAARAETASSAPAAQTFIVNTADGYGVNDCIKTDEDCAKIVADAWCEAHGHGDARNFGPVGDLTASIRPVSVKARAQAQVIGRQIGQDIGQDAVYISCGE